MSRATSPVKAKRVTVKKSPLPGLLSFGADNLFPQTLLTVLSDSVTGMACVSAKAEFIEGNGFRDKNLFKMVVHRDGLTADGLLNQIAWNVALFEVIALHISYNGNGQVCGIEPIPVEMIRLAEPNEFGKTTHYAICPYLDSTYKADKKKEFKLLPKFNPDPEVVLEQMKEVGGISNYYGQVLYEPFKKPGDAYYVVPSWFPGIVAIESEGQLDQYDWRTITSGFNISGILKLIEPDADPVTGDPYDPSQDPNSVESQLSNHQGANNAASILIIRESNQQALDAIQFIDTTGAQLSDRYRTTTERVENRIVRAFRVPRELMIGGRVGGIAPTGIELKMASQLMQQTVNRTQRKISEVMSNVLRYWKEPVGIQDFSIENLNYFPEDDTAAAQPN